MYMCLILWDPFYETLIIKEYKIHILNLRNNHANMGPNIEGCAGVGGPIGCGDGKCQPKFVTCQFMSYNIEPGPL